MSKIMRKDHHTTEDEDSLIKKAFDSFDTDKDGFLNFQEIKAAVKSLGLDAEKSQILNMMKNFCDKFDDKIDYENFYYITADKVIKRDPIEQIKTAYKLLCESVNSKTIGLQELKKINAKFNTELSDVEMQAMIEEFDIDGDNHINEEEFIAIMEPSLKQRGNFKLKY